MSVTTETRQEAYDRVFATLGARQRIVLESLGMVESVTANELAVFMYDMGHFPNSDRNNVHPRLNELVALGQVEIVGKRKCSVTGRTCAVYRERCN